MSLIEVGFGGGCHWCTEAIFTNTPEAFDIRQGWIRSSGENSSLSEAVLLKCHLDQLELLIHIHLKTHSSTNDHQFRKKYRSAVYYSNSDHKKLIQNIIDCFERKVITKVLPLVEFKLNDEKYLHYYKKNKGNQFCETYIEPKLKKIAPQ
jgi:peptide-methionine (S)-S-oxide reductase